MRKFVLIAVVSMFCLVVCSSAVAAKKKSKGTNKGQETKTFMATIVKIDKVDKENYIIRVKIKKDDGSSGSEKDYKVTKEFLKDFKEKDEVKIILEIG